MPTIENMTLKELQRMIDARIDERLNSLLGTFEVTEQEPILVELPVNADDVDA